MSKLLLPDGMCPHINEGVDLEWGLTVGGRNLAVCDTCWQREYRARDAYVAAEIAVKSANDVLAEYPKPGPGQRAAGIACDAAEVAAYQARLAWIAVIHEFAGFTYPPTAGAPELRASELPARG